jgi:hypothetical protein
MTIQNQPQTQIKHLSYSAIKMFLDNRIKFRKKYILKERVKEDNESIRTGNLVDFYALPVVDPTNEALMDKEFNKQFHQTIHLKPGGQMGDLVENLKKRTNEAIKGDVCEKNLEELIELAFDDTKYNAKREEVNFKKKDVSFALNEFLEKKIGYDYYFEFRNNLDKTVVTVPEIEKALIIKDQLYKDSNTYDIFNPPHNPDVEWHNQFPFEVEIDGYTLRGKVDRMKIDKKNLMIKPYDLKCTFQVESFEWAYLDDMYYIQNGLYYYALSEMFPDYYVEPVSFIVADSNMFLRPLVWHTSVKHATQGMNGFDYRGKRWKGITEALKEITWHVKSGDWRISFDNYRNFGNLSIKEFAI